MRRALRILAAAVLAVASSLATPAVASPSTKVEWTKVVVPERADGAELEKTLRTLLAKAAKKADFGKGKHVALSARVQELVTEQQGDVLRVRCTLVGRVEGGPSARSKIAFGGKVAERRELEKQVLTMVANGVVSRLAQIVRSR
jgi:hypothetical protein